MGAQANFGMLLDVIGTAQQFVQVFVYVYSLLIFVYVLSSWFTLPYSVWLSRIQRFLYDVCEPYIRIFRRILPPLGPLDLSPLIAVIALIALGQLLDRLLDQFA